MAIPFAAIISALASGIATLGIGSGGQNVEPLVPGLASTLANDLRFRLTDQLDRVSQLNAEPLVFPGSSDRARALTGSARIAGLPTGTVGFRPAAAEFGARREFDLGLGGFERSGIDPGLDPPDRPGSGPSRPQLRTGGDEQQRTGADRQESFSTENARNSLLRVLQQLTGQA